jgi:LPS export ABC transporter protein LptC
VKQRLVYLLIYVSVFALGCGRQEARPKIETTYIGDDYPVQETWDAAVTFSDSGKTKAVLHAKYSAQYKQEKSQERELTGGLRVDFYDKSGKFTSFLVADRALIYHNSDMEASGNVVVTSTDSTVLRTEQMKWSNDDQKIRSDQFVTITKPTETLRGYGFESDQSMKNYRIFKVSGEAKIKEKPSSTSQ